MCAPGNEIAQTREAEDMISMLAISLKMIKERTGKITKISWLMSHVCHDSNQLHANDMRPMRRSTAILLASFRWNMLTSVYQHGDSLLYLLQLFGLLTAAGSGNILIQGAAPSKLEIT